MAERGNPRLLESLMLKGLPRRNPMPPLGEAIYGTTTEGRPAFLNRDGSLSTERTVGVSDSRINQGQETEIPTIFNGRELSQEDALDIIATLGMIQGTQSGMVVDPETGRRLLPQSEVGPPPARSHSIEVEPNMAYKPLEQFSKKKGK